MECGVLSGGTGVSRFNNQMWQTPKYKPSQMVGLLLGLPVHPITVFSRVQEDLTGYRKLLVFFEYLEEFESVQSNLRNQMGKGQCSISG